MDKKKCKVDKTNGMMDLTFICGGIRNVQNVLLVVNKYHADATIP